MQADYIFLGLSQLTESAIPSLQVKLNNYTLSWQECLTEGLMLIFEYGQRLDYHQFANKLDYSYGETIMEHFEELEAVGLGDSIVMFNDAVEAFLQLSWIYYNHFYQVLRDRYGHIAPALDSLYIHSHLAGTNDVCVALHWDTNRMPEPTPLFYGEVSNPYTGTRY